MFHVVLRFFAVTAVIAFTLLALNGKALSVEIEGVIKSLNTDIGAIILTDGTQIMLPAEFNVEGLDPGKKIYVDYDEIDGAKVALIIELIDE